MRNRFWKGLPLLLAVALCFQGTAPLFAADGITFNILQPLPNQTITESGLPVAFVFQSATDSPVVRVEVDLDGQLLCGRSRTFKYPPGVSASTTPSTTAISARSKYAPANIPSW